MTEFKKHLTYKIFTNFLKIPVNLTLNAIFPRLLGPVNYGNFDFLYDNATKVIGFFDTGSSIAFYTRLSQNYRDRLLIKFYWALVFLLAASYLIFVFGVGAFGFTNSVWPNQSFFLVLLSAVLGILTFFSNTIILVMDASNLTVKSEKVRMAQLVLSMATYGFIYFIFKRIDLAGFFYIQCLLVVFLFFGCWLMLRRSGMQLITTEKIQRQAVKEYGAYFWRFSNPLLVYSLVGLVMGMGARWILQLYGGSIQQAYFGLAAKIGSFVLLFTSAIMPLLMREFSKQFGEKDFARMTKLYVLSFKGLYLISMFISVLVFFNADFISSFLGGAEFKNATLVLSIMAFYPVHQSLGQINGSLFYSTDRNRIYRNVGLFFMPLSLLLSYFFIAPENMYGLNMGAKGLAIQMVLIQIATVNTNSYVNCKFFNISFAGLLAYQVVVPVIFLLSGWACMLVLGWLPNGSFLKFTAFSALISLISLAWLLLFPAIAGFNTRSELFEFIKIGKKSK